MSGVSQARPRVKKTTLPSSHPGSCPPNYPRPNPHDRTPKSPLRSVRLRCALKSPNVPHRTFLVGSGLAKMSVRPSGVRPSDVRPASARPASVRRPSVRARPFLPLVRMTISVLEGLFVTSEACSCRLPACHQMRRFSAPLPHPKSPLRSALFRCRLRSPNVPRQAFLGGPGLAKNFTLIWDAIPTRRRSSPTRHRCTDSTPAETLETNTCARAEGLRHP